MHNIMSVLVSSKLDSIRFILSVGPPPPQENFLFVKVNNVGLPKQAK